MPNNSHFQTMQIMSESSCFQKESLAIAAMRDSGGVCHMGEQAVELAVCGCSSDVVGRIEGYWKK